MRIERRALFVGLAVIVLVLVLGTGATVYTSHPSFCASCHEARGAYTSRGPTPATSQCTA